MDKVPVRSNRLMFRKYTQYLIPTMITYAALSLNEFADSMLVSNLLGSEAMSIISMGMPIMLVMSAAYSLLGNGGATVYAIAIGSRDHEKAGKSMMASVVIALLTGVLIVLFGSLFSSQITDLLCRNPMLHTQFEEYLFVLLLSAPLVIVVLTFVSFLPAAGYPGFPTAVNVIANVVNLAMDYVYIHYFNMNVEGAAWATFTGYACAALIVLFALSIRKIKVFFSNDIVKSLALRAEIARLGRPDAVNQIGLAIQFAVCNGLATTAAGADGMVAFSLCIQASSVISVFIGAVIGSAIPILAVLHGQRDFTGEAGVLKTALRSMLVVAAGGIFCFTVFAPNVAALYNITEPGQLALACMGLRIYSLMLLPRNLVLVYYRYLKVIGQSRYSIILSALDSFALILPVAWIMATLFGINGFWWSFLITEVLILAIILVCNPRIAANSEGKLQGILLTEHDEEAEPVLDVTISSDSSDISLISETLQQICEEKGMRRQDALKAALVVEEIAVYAANRKNQSSHVDILVRIYKGKVEIDFRSLGAAFNPLEDDEQDMRENVLILRSIASEIETEYLLGMNCTRITLKG